MSQTPAPGLGQPALSPSERKSPVFFFVWGALVVFLAAIILGRLALGDTRLQGAIVIEPQPSEAEELPVYGTLPDIELVESGGQAFKISDLRGKVWVASLFFTHCAAACPMMASQLAKFQEAVDNPNIVLVSISVDPERDTPERLREYAALTGAERDRWFFLTGKWDAISELAEEHLKLGTGQEREDLSTHDEMKNAAEDAAGWVMDSSPGGPAAKREVEVVNPILHSDRFALIDTQGRIRGYYDGLDPLELAMLQSDARFLLTEGTPQP